MSNILWRYVYSCLAEGRALRDGVSSTAQVGLDKIIVEMWQLNCDSSIKRNIQIPW